MFNALVKIEGAFAAAAAPPRKEAFLIACNADVATAAAAELQARSQIDQCSLDGVK